MRSRSNSGVRLDYYQRMVAKTIMRHQVKLMLWWLLSAEEFQH